MKVIMNDTPIELDAAKRNLAQAVLHSGVNDFKGLAVAVNEAVIPRTNWETFILKENDTITIIRATQGG
jgi:sulfur carrier protein